MAKDPDAEGDGQHTEEGEEGHSGEETEIHEGNGRSR
jgi:DASH complex subunit DAD1